MLFFTRTYSADTDFNINFAIIKYKQVKFSELTYTPPLNVTNVTQRKLPRPQAETPGHPFVQP